MELYQLSTFMAENQLFKKEEYAAYRQRNCLLIAFYLEMTEVLELSHQTHCVWDRRLSWKMPARMLKFDRVINY